MPVKPRISVGETFRSPFGRGGQGHSVKSIADLMSETDISFVSSSRPSTDRMSSVTYDFMDSGEPLGFQLAQTLASHLFTQDQSSLAPVTIRDFHQFHKIAAEHHLMGDMESEMRRLKLELKQTMDLYSTACREALTAKRKLNRWRIEEERRLEESRFSEETALSIIEQEKARCREAIEAAEEAKKRAAMEAQRRLNIEKALKEAEKTKRAKDNLSYHDIRYRRYIAVKVLRPDAAQGRSQFQREVEVLSLIRHPNMVLLLGACPEYGILVYEYMAKGSLEDRLFKRGNTPALSWQIRFRIVAEIATGLLFLHQTKPEPLVHRDLKPGNILLDNNYISKISDVGLARLVPTTSENVTQYHMTSAAGTFCYIDPEYQQTGMLGVKSDVYSLGILLLQVITAKPPMGLTHIVEQAIENETLKEIVDSDVPDWPIEETFRFA
ncbi:BINDING PROTEIN putative-RELATED [Salix viminalis]|uniref:BINDING PROTEIN putative-RELATED n=1 Tax=Salix viminalis TaxID=40686 RepID=A0A9Q0NUA0_SALVM|nr:BINDING PROTEIN putative-RELATED [Salix viminalis]